MAIPIDMGNKRTWWESHYSYNRALPNLARDVSAKLFILLLLFSASARMSYVAMWEDIVLG